MNDDSASKARFGIDTHDGAFHPFDELRQIRRKDDGTVQTQYGQENELSHVCSIINVCGSRRRCELIGGRRSAMSRFSQLTEVLFASKEHHHRFQAQSSN